MRTCFISGKFNVVHPGHLRLFRYAKEIADKLVLGVFVDAYAYEGDILVPEDERLEGVRSNIWVDEAFLVTDLEASIRQARPSIVLKGKEHEGKFNPEQQVVDEIGSVLKFGGGDTRLSSSALIRAENDFENSILSRSARFLTRHKCNQATLSQAVGSMAGLKTLVVGDLIVDRYIDCQPIGMSSEDPTVVVSPLAEKTFIGGAGIVAAHANQLGASATIVSVCGDDEVGERAKEDLTSLGVDAVICVDSGRPTTLKTRYRASGKTLLRVNDFRDHRVDKNIAGKILANIQDHIDECDVLIFSDFSYGLFSDQIVSAIVNQPRLKKLVTAADSQSSSQIGDISRFRGMTLLTPTEREARLAVRDDESGLVGISEKLRAITGAEHIPITLASEGVFLHRPDATAGEWTDDQVPALNQNPVDVSGAGDAFLVSTALALASGADIWASIFIGSLASACQVERVGNVPLSRDEILKKLAQ